MKKLTQKVFFSELIIEGSKVLELSASINDGEVDVAVRDEYMSLSNGDGESGSDGELLYVQLDKVQFENNLSLSSIKDM